MFTLVKVNSFQNGNYMGRFSHWEVRLNAAKVGEGLIIFAHRKKEVVIAKYKQLVHEAQIQGLMAA